LFEKVRSVDAVVSCAGHAVFKPLAELTDADFEFGLRNKLMGPVSLARTARGSCPRRRLHHLDHRHAGDTADAGRCVFSTVNAGLEGFVRAAGLDMPRRPRVNAVSPPWIRETMMDMDPASGLFAADCAKAYVAAVEGAQQDEIIDALKFFQ
jgi:NAD(P)-dependent dehydrogenase (short-subunit alcohol dehydrogenase family)